ncbi:MAG TPA: hypothetical protein VFC90_06760 [Planctomycetota bacterium]|nr:hypothetical protein [Planctomycetota bacterium]
MTEDDRGVAQRRHFYRIVFVLAALYNLAFALWTAAWPLSFFRIFGLAPTNHPAIWQCLGMVIGVYGAGYAWAAFRPERGKPIIALGLAGKLLGPIGWVAIVASGEWPVRTITLILFNDVVWWLPFSLFLLEGTRLGDRIRSLAAPACALLNAAAGVAMLVLLRPGMEVEPDPAARAAYIAGHPVAWRAGWALWIGAAISLAGFYAWWGSRLGRARPATSAFVIVLAAVACDLFAESLYLGWLPQDLETTAPLGTLLTGVAANGLYTIAGILLTLATPLGRALRLWAALVWTCGVGVTLFTVTGFIPGLVASTAGLMILLPPWVWMMGRRLEPQAP